MIRFICSVIFSIISTACFAQPVAIQTGEHQDFSRVVLTLPTGASWQLGRGVDGYILRSSVLDGYDTSRFFDLIPRQRIRAVSQNIDTGELRFNVDCICNVDAFLEGPRFLVIDIRDGAPAENAPYEAFLEDIDRPQSSRQVAVSTKANTVGREHFLPLIFPVGSQRPEVERAEVPTDDENSSLGGQVADDVRDPSAVQQSLADLEQSITESLARGLSQGLLESDLGGGGNQVGMDAVFEALTDLEGENAPGVRATTSVDRAAIPDDPYVPLTQQGEECVSNAYLDVINWGDERPFHVQISEARAGLTTEFDRIDHEAVIKLARLFVYFGFGREAMQILDLDEIRSQERRYLVALAQIIDGETVEAGLFEHQVSCDSAVAVWAILAETDDALDAKVNRPAALREYKALPVLLQAHLGPRLSGRFLAIADSDAANQVLETARSHASPRLEVALAETDLTRALGDADAAAMELAEIATSDVRATPDVMTAFFTESVANNTQVSDDDFQLANALRFEYAQMPAAADLAVAQARVYLHQGQFVEAKAIMDETATDIGAGRLSELRNGYANAASARMDDTNCLQFVFYDLSTGLREQTENRVARRVLDIGFPERALDILEGPTIGGDRNARQLLRAEALLAMGDLAAVTDTLDDLYSDEAENLRKVVVEMQNQNVLISSLVETASTEQLAWRRGDWDDLLQSDDPLLRAASTAVLAQGTAPLDSVTPLASSQELLNDSAQARDVLGQLLDRFTAPESF